MENSWNIVSPSYLRQDKSTHRTWDTGIGNLSLPNLMTSFVFNSNSDCTTPTDSTGSDIPSLSRWNNSSPMTGYRKLDLNLDCASDSSWTADTPTSPPLTNEAAAHLGGNPFFPCQERFKQALTGIAGWAANLSSHKLPAMHTAKTLLSPAPPLQQQVPSDLWQQQCNLDPQVLSDLASDWMVNFVCAQTRPWSRYRQAAETLAKSNLNPNAAVFTPKTAVMAAAATDSSPVVETCLPACPASIVPSSGGSPVTSLERSPSIVSTECFDDSDMSSKAVKSEDNTGMLFKGGSRTGVSTDLVCSSPMPVHESRSVSESSTDSFIHFTSSISPPSSGSRTFTILVRAHSERNDDDESDNESDVDEDSAEDSDWDEDESDGGCVDLDDFQEFMPLLCVTNLTGSSRSCQPKQLTSFQSKQLLCPTSPAVAASTYHRTIRSCMDTYPVAFEDHRTLAEVNQRWQSLPVSCPHQPTDELSHEASVSQGASCDVKEPLIVRFNLIASVILEPEEQAEELRQARISDFGQRQADRERMERLLGPILTPRHRAAVWQRLRRDSLATD